MRFDRAKASRRAGRRAANAARDFIRVESRPRAIERNGLGIE